jgi:hypothetical protein
MLLMRDGVENVQPAWYPAQPASNTRKKTPGQVQRGALRLLVKLGTPAKATRVAGKGKGRAKGYRPAPKTRFEIVKKTVSASNRAQNSS